MTFSQVPIFGELLSVRSPEIHPQRETNQRLTSCGKRYNIQSTGNYTLISEQFHALGLVVAFVPSPQSTSRQLYLNLNMRNDGVQLSSRKHPDFRRNLRHISPVILSSSLAIASSHVALLASEVLVVFGSQGLGSRYKQSIYKRSPPHDGVNLWG